MTHISLLSLFQTLGFVLGPAMQSALSPIGEKSEISLDSTFHLDMYAACGWVMLLKFLFSYCSILFLVCYIQSFSFYLFFNVWRYVGAITGLLSFFMFLPGIFNEYTVDKTSSQDNQSKKHNKISSKGSRHNPKSIVREFSTVSFTGPPPLETKKSVALLSIAETPIAQNKSFWGRLRTKWKPFFFFLINCHYYANHTENQTN